MNRQPFPSRAPIGLIFGGLLAVAAVVPLFAIWQAEQEPVRAFYLSTYLGFFTSGKLQDFTLLTDTPRAVGPAAACPSTAPYVVSVSSGADVETAGRCVVTTTPEKIKGWLRTAVYGNESSGELLRIPLLLWMVAGLGFLIGGGLYDWRRKQRARIGFQIRGPELVSRWRFNRRVRGDGFPILLENRSNLFEAMLGKQAKVLRIRRRDENKNIICMSDPGGGKTSDSDADS